MEKEINDYQAKTPPTEGQILAERQLSMDLFQELRNKIIKGTASDEEDALLKAHLHSLFEQDVMNNEALSEHELEKRKSMYQDFQARVRALDNRTMMPMSMLRKTRHYWREVPGKIAHYIYSRFTVLATTLCLASVLMLITFLSFYRNTLAPLQTTLTSLPNSPRVSVLPDGSVVTVWKNSMVTYAADFQKNRIVSLKGEAHFQIVKDLKRPFQVKSGNLSITVTGTTFKVISFANTQYDTVDVSEGSVRVSSGAEEMTLRAGQRLLFDKENNIVRLSLFNFKNVTLETAMEEVSKYFNTDLEWQNDQLKDYHVTACYFDASSINDIVEGLTVATGTCYQLNNNVITITDDGSACLNKFLRTKRKEE